MNDDNGMLFFIIINIANINNNIYDINYNTML